MNRYMASIELRPNHRRSCYSFYNATILVTDTASNQEFNMRFRRRKLGTPIKVVTTTTCQNVGPLVVPDGIYTAIWDRYSVCIFIKRKKYEVLSDERGPLDSKAILTVINGSLSVIAQEYGPETPKFTKF